MSDRQLTDELVAYVSFQRMGLVLDDQSLVAIKRKAEAFFRQHDVGDVVKERIMANAIPRVLNPSKLNDVTSEWMKKNRLSNVQIQNAAYQGFRLKKPGILNRLWWWVNGPTRGQKMRSKWLAAHPIRVLPAAQ